MICRQHQFPQDTAEEGQPAGSRWVGRGTELARSLLECLILTAAPPDSGYASPHLGGRGGHAEAACHLYGGKTIRRPLAAATRALTT